MILCDIPIFQRYSDNHLILKRYLMELNDILRISFQLFALEHIDQTSLSLNIRLLFKQYLDDLLKDRQTR